MAKVKNILRCYAMGMGIKEISNTFNLSRNTVRKYVRQFMRSGYSLDSLMSISELQLQELFEAKELPDRRQSLRRIELEALLPDYAKRLRRRGVTAALLIRRIDHAHNLCEIRAVVVIWNIVILQLKIIERAVLSPLYYIMLHPL